MGVVIVAVLVIVPPFSPSPESAHIWDNLPISSGLLQGPGGGRHDRHCQPRPGLVRPLLSRGFISEQISSRFGATCAAPLAGGLAGLSPFDLHHGLPANLVSVYRYPGGAAGPGRLHRGRRRPSASLYYREKRIWCRCLCPASGVFAVLAKIARSTTASTGPPGTATMAASPRWCAPWWMCAATSASRYHACGRCTGQREAVALAWRSPGFAEVLDPENPPARRYRRCCSGVLGVAAAFQWTVSPWFRDAKLAPTNWWNASTLPC